MKTILLIEDDTDMVELGSHFLRVAAAGCTVISALTHEQAMEQVMQNPLTDLVFLDGNLNPKVKDLDTLDLVGFIKMNCPKAIIVATSSHPEWSEKLIQAGCDCSMPKSTFTSIDELRAVLNTVKSVEMTA